MGRTGSKEAKEGKDKTSHKAKRFWLYSIRYSSRGIGGVKEYFISAIDTKLEFVLTVSYKGLTSRNMKDF